MVLVLNVLLVKRRGECADSCFFGFSDFRFYWVFCTGGVGEYESRVEKIIQIEDCCVILFLALYQILRLRVYPLRIIL